VDRQLMSYPRDVVAHGNVSELRRLPAHFGMCVPANRDLVGH
jgi:hypothetical protein